MIAMSRYATPQGSEPSTSGTLTVEAVRDLFARLETGDADAFFARVADDVSWTVMGTHPLAGKYHSKADFRAATFARLNRILREGVLLRVTHMIVQSEWAVVELEALSTALNGEPFANRYCWVCRFAGETIVEVRAYLDSALVAHLLQANEPRA
jgi:ketosteroid isomerase-like protein